MDYTPVLSSMSSTYPRIDWTILLSYCPIRNNRWQYCNLDPTNLTGSYPPIFWILIGSRSFIFFRTPELVKTPPLTSERWLAWWTWICLSPPYMVTPLTSLVCSRTLVISAYMRRTSMVLSPLIWTARSILNNSIKSSQPTTQSLWFPRYLLSGSRIHKYSTFDVDMFD